MNDVPQKKICIAHKMREDELYWTKFRIVKYQNRILLRALTT
jgi:hypothetical protein